MLDTPAVARSLTAADFTPAQADGRSPAGRRAGRARDQPDQFKAGLAEIRAGQRTEIRPRVAGVARPAAVSAAAAAQRPRSGCTLPAAPGSAPPGSPC